MTPEHLLHLSNIAHGGLMRSITPDDVASELMEGGYAEKRAGGMVATDMGQRFLVMKGFKPKAWQ